MKELQSFTKCATRIFCLCLPIFQVYSKTSIMSFQMLLLWTSIGVQDQFQLAYIWHIKGAKAGRALKKIKKWRQGQTSSISPKPVHVAFLFLNCGPNPADNANCRSISGHVNGFKCCCQLRISKPHVYA
jgi:hypothetical protein